MIWEKVRDLNTKEIELLKNANRCEKACKKLITETVMHFEQNLAITETFWEGIIEKHGRYDEDGDELTYKYDVDNKFLSCSKKFLVESNEIVNKLERNKKIKKMVMEAMNEN